jgi:hypothetical protein
MRRAHVCAAWVISLAMGCNAAPVAMTSQDGDADDSPTIVIGAGGAAAGDADGAAGLGGSGGAATAGSGVAGSACVSSDGSPPSPGDAGSFGASVDASFRASAGIPFDGGSGGGQSCPLAFCDNACTDLMADDANCGACGTACPATSTCVGGQCSLVVRSVASAAPGCGALTLAFADTTLYYTDSGHGTVNSVVPSVDGPPLVIASGEASPGAIVASGSTLFWIDSVVVVGCSSPTTNGTIRTISLPDGAPTTLVSEVNTTGGIGGLALSADGRTVYYSAGQKIRKISGAGGAAVDVAQELPGDMAGALAVDGDAIAYVSSVFGDIDVVTPVPGTIASCGESEQFGMLTGQVDCEPVAQSQGPPLLTTILFRDGIVYWASSNVIESGSRPDTGLEMEIAPSVSGGAITTLTGSPTAIYFGEDDTGSGAYLERVGLDFSVLPVPLARGQASVLSIAVGPTRVYWSTSACVINATGL